MRTVNNQRGFTLVEMMVVVAIIGVLSTLAKFGYDGYVEGARQAEAKLTLPTLAANMDQFKVEFGFYFKDLNGIKFIRKGNRNYYAAGFASGNNFGDCGAANASGLYVNASTSYTTPSGAKLSGGGAAGNVGCAFIKPNLSVDVAGTSCSTKNEADPLKSGTAGYPNNTTVEAAGVEGTSFIAGVVGSIKPSFRCDVWVINEQGNLDNVQAGR